MCVCLMVSENDVWIFTITLANLWSKLLILDTMGPIDMLSLRFLSKLYNVGVVELDFISIVQVLFSFL